jgi:16S rRNA (cytosine967-C5)-methyltransferase
MLDHAVSLLKPGGTLVYCTCSLEPEEGEAHLAPFLARQPVSLQPISAGELGGMQDVIAANGTMRTLPVHLPNAVPRLSGLDGFFAMRLVKRG